LNVFFLPADNPIMRKDIIHQAIPIHRRSTDPVRVQASDRHNVSVAHFGSKSDRNIVGLRTQDMQNGSHFNTTPFSGGISEKWRRPQDDVVDGHRLTVYESTAGHDLFNKIQ
jgi:hypothetical protein